MKTVNGLRKFLVVLFMVSNALLITANKHISNRAFVQRHTNENIKKYSSNYIIKRKGKSDIKFNGGWFNLLRDVGIDMIAASSAALSISPFIAIFDRSIIISASRGGTIQAALSSGLRDLKHPLSFFRLKEVWWVWGLYAGTFCVANAISTVADAFDVDKTGPKLIGTTAVNLPASIAKDQALARMFGPSKATTAIAGMTLVAYGLFVIRDIVSIAASFTLPEKLSNHLTEACDWSVGIANGTSQLIVPSAMQIITTPIHLAGIDIFNRPAANAVMRINMICRLYSSSLVLRFGRTALAFGVGGVINTNVRNVLRSSMHSASW